MGFVLLAGSGFAQVGQFGGPSILAPDSGQLGRTGGKPLAFRFYANASAFYDSGLTSAATDESGNLTSQSGSGTQASLGAYGYHAGKRSLTALDYRGMFRYYPNRTYFTGSDHLLSLNHVTQVSRRVELSLSQGAGTFGTSLNGFGMAIVSDPLLQIANPAAELFDARTHALISSAALTFRMTERLHFTASGSGFIVRRHSKALASVDGYQANGGINYRLSRRQQIGLNYGFMHMSFSQSFGGTDVHFAKLSFSRTLNRSWNFLIQAGPFRAESQRLVSVRLDPVIAALTGITRGVEAAHRVQTGSMGQVELNGTFPRSHIAFTYTRAIAPGNGVLLAARMDTGGARYSYTGFRRLNLGLSSFYASYSSLSQSLGKFSTISAGGGLNYRLAGFLHLSSRLDYLVSELRGSHFNRDRYRAMIGLSFSPGEVPLALW